MARARSARAAGSKIVEKAHHIKGRNSHVPPQHHKNVPQNFGFSTFESMTQKAVSPNQLSSPTSKSVFSFASLEKPKLEQP